MEERRFVATNLIEPIIRSQGRTKRWIAGRAGITESMLGHVIAGRRTISEPAALEIVAVLQVPFDMLFISTSVAQGSTQEASAA